MKASTFLLSSVILMSTLSMSPAFSAPINGDTLIKSCQEYVGIYDSRGKKSLLAGISTSVSEAMQAGICRGMLEEHSNHTYQRCRKDFYAQAEYIASLDSKTSRRMNAEKILDKACYD